MSLPMKAEVRAFNLNALFSDAKKIDLFSEYFTSGYLEVKSNKVPAKTLADFCKTFPSIGYKVTVKRKAMGIDISSQKEFFELLLALLEAELTLYGNQLHPKEIHDIRKSYIREFRRQTPYTSEVYTRLEAELVREQLVVDTDDESFKASVADIIAKVHERRQNKTQTKPTGLLD